MKINETTALVTGANRGLGRDLAVELLARGATVYAGARNPDAVDIPGARVVELDITSADSVRRAAAQMDDITLLVNNAGIFTQGSMLTGQLDDIHLEFDTHFFGTLSVVRALAPRIVANGGGTILNILSVLSWISTPDAGAYSAAKSAEWSLTNALRNELAAQNVRVVGLHVGFMDTDMSAWTTAPKSDPRDVARIAIDGVRDGLYEILADDLSHQVRDDLAHGVEGLYPELVSPR